MAEEILCPKCDDWNRPDDDWDFIDGETHRVQCRKCKHKFLVVIERPIEYYVQEIKDK